MNLCKKCKRRNILSNLAYFLFSFFIATDLVVLLINDETMASSVSQN